LFEWNLLIEGNAVACGAPLAVGRYHPEVMAKTGKSRFKGGKGG
jgi:hypothetical protein